MTGTEVITAARRWLFDETTPYKWSEAELTDYLNWTLNEIAKVTDYIIDPSTVAITEIATTKGYQDYEFDTRILQIQNARLASETTPLTKTTLKELNEAIPSWRYDYRVTGTDIGFEVNSGADIIRSVTTDLSGFEVGDLIVISGAGSSGNNSMFEVASATTAAITLVTTDTLISETSGSSITITNPDADDPEKYLLDYRQGYITLYPCPTSADRVIFETVTLPGTAYSYGTGGTSSNLGTLALPVRYDYHLDLIDGILCKAYRKSTPSCYNIEKAREHEAQFKKLLQKIIKDGIKLKRKQGNLTPHLGAI
jgi:hypothetical protein